MEEIYLMQVYLLEPFKSGFRSNFIDSTFSRSQLGVDSSIKSNLLFFFCSKAAPFGLSYTNCKSFTNRNLKSAYHFRIAKGKLKEMNKEEAVLLLSNKLPTTRQGLKVDPSMTGLSHASHFASNEDPPTPS